MEEEPEKINILLVNDRPAQLLAWQSILTDLGQNLIPARSGVEALERLLVNDVAAILLDVNMPVMDGFETAALIRQRPRTETTPILFVSGINVHETDRAQGYALGAVDYIFTPVVPEILRAKIGVFAELYKKNRQIAAQAAQLNELNQLLGRQLNAIQALNEQLILSNTELTHSQEQLRQLTARLQALREEERASIAREIHDDLGGSLTGLKLDLRQMAKVLEPRADPLTARFDALYSSIDQIIQNVRRIATELRPAMLDDLGLAATVEWQLREYEQRSGIHSLLHLESADLAIPPATATALFRIFQEALTNVARHAQATQVEVTLQSLGDHLMLKICDNGRGIQPNELRNGRSLGLVSMRERVQLLAGEISIQGRPGQGTVVNVNVPLASPPNVVV